MAKDKSAQVVICGAGILGISTAFALAQQGVTNIVIVDDHPPLTLTSDKSSECYRNWWPGPGDAMVQLMNRSITLMEARAAACNNMFKLNRRGYLYVTTDAARVSGLQAAAVEAANLGAGALREHTNNNASYQPYHAEGFEGPDGADLLTDPATIQKHFPYLTPETAAVLHVRRAGWLSAQSYGMWMWEQARTAGVQLVTGRVAALETQAGAVSQVALADGTTIATSAFINAAGPHIGSVSQLLNIKLPIYNELHLKAAFNDQLSAVGREAPLVICADEQELPWSEDERAMLAEDPDTAWLLGRLPSGAHTRPEGDAAAQSIIVLWDVHNEKVEPAFPIGEDPLYAETAIRGLARILPGMRGYLERMPRPSVDGGYYTKTQENRPLAGPLGVPGAYVIGAASGYGIMAAAGLAELLAAHITGIQLPPYAPLFSLARYQNPGYQALLANWGESWQL